MRQDKGERLRCEQRSLGCVPEVERGQRYPRRRRNLAFLRASGRDRESEDRRGEGGRRAPLRQIAVIVSRQWEEQQNI